MEIALELKFCDQAGKEIYWILRPDWRTDSYTESFHRTHSSLIITCPCWTPRLQLQWYNKALADIWYNFATCKINFCHKWWTTLFWMERLDNSDDISRGCELGQITRLKNQGALSSQGQREGFVHREAERCFRAIKLCTIIIENYRGTRDWLWWLLCWKHYRSLDSDKICADINDSALPFKNHQTCHKL